LYSSHQQQIGDSTPALALSLPSPKVAWDVIQEATAGLHEVLALPEAAALHERLTAILAKLECVGGRLAPEKPTVVLPSEAQAGRLPEQTVDFLATGTEETGRLSRKTVDSSAIHRVVATRKTDRLPEQTVNSADTDGNENGRLVTEKSTFSSLSDTQIGRLPEQTVDSAARLVDSGAETLPNVNVVLKTLLGSLNVNVKAVVNFLIAVFREEPTKRGYYYNLYKTHANPDAWLAATVETLVGLHLTKTVRFPGKYFYDRCVQLHKTISPEATALVEQYGGFTLSQLLERWHQPSSQEAPGAKPDKPVVRESRRQPLTLRIPRDRKMPGMSKAELKNLLQELHSHPDTSGWRTQPYRQDDDSCALLVENVLQRQRWIYSLRNWQESVASLFPPCLTDMESHRKTSSAKRVERKEQ
jgi:hypothetical protein